MSRSFRKENRKFFISVEGENCEKQYFEHLQKLINACPESKYNVNFVIKAQVTPRQMIKRCGSMPIDRDAQGKPIPYMHVADIEDYYDSGFRNHFLDLLDEMKIIKKESGKAYLMGYSNLTFDLWMLLHVNDMVGTVANRDKYLNPINRYFNKSFSRLDDYKDRDEFDKILKDFVSLDSVRKAICRAEGIKKWNSENNKETCEHNGFRFYKDNPDTTVGKKFVESHIYTETVPVTTTVLGAFGKPETVTTMQQQEYKIPEGYYPAAFVQVKFDVVNAKTNQSIWSLEDKQDKVYYTGISNIKPKELYTDIITDFATNLRKNLKSRKAGGQKLSK